MTTNISKTPQEVFDTIASTLDEIERLTDFYIAAALHQSNARAALENKATASLLGGEIAGKNEEERKANRRNLLADYIEAERLADLELDAVGLRLKYQRDRLSGLQAMSTMLFAMGQGVQQ